MYAITLDISKYDFYVKTAACLWSVPQLNLEPVKLSPFDTITF